MIERAARAICINHDLDPDFGNPPMWKTKWIIDDAIAVIKAIRQPTEEMLRPYVDAYYRDAEIAEAWKNMIDAILKE